jgi:hypothetical protein
MQGGREETAQKVNARGIKISYDSQAFPRTQL